MSWGGLGFVYTRQCMLDKQNANYWRVESEYFVWEWNISNATPVISNPLGCGKRSRIENGKFINALSLKCIQISTYFESMCCFESCLAWSSCYILTNSTVVTGNGAGEVVNKHRIYGVISSTVYMWSKTPRCNTSWLMNTIKWMNHSQLP